MVAPNLVLTAAHCRGVSGGVRIGSIYATGSYYGVERNVIRTFTHPSYNRPNSLDYDFLLLELDESVDVNVYKPINLNFDDNEPRVNDMLTVIGFGSLSENGGHKNTLQKVQVPANSHNQCVAQYGIILEDANLCAGYTSGGYDSCQGDSGGPLFKRVNDEWTQMGIVSWGVGCARPNRSGVYARISGSRGWLKSVICSRSHYPQPSFCGGGNAPAPTTPAPTRPPTPSPILSPTTSPPTPYPTRLVTSSPTTRAPTPFPTTKLTPSPTTRAPTPYPSLYPTEYPSSTPTNGCTICDDRAMTWMEVQNEKCSTSLHLIEQNCNKSSYWTNNRVCQLSCFNAGYGYPGDDCCQKTTTDDDSSSSSSETTPSPEQQPTTTPLPTPTTYLEECTTCTDVGNSWMQAVGNACPSSYLLFSKCNKSASWRANKFCQYSCYMTGNGYDGDICCPSGVDPITRTPTRAPTTIPPTTIPPTTIPPTTIAPTTKPPTTVAEVPAVMDVIVQTEEPPSTREPTTTIIPIISTEAPSKSQQPTTLPSQEPSTAPSSVNKEVDCTTCSDIGNSWMVDMNISCDSDQALTLISRKCNKNDTWRDNKYCQYTCFVSNNRYENDNCCSKSSGFHWI